MGDSPTPEEPANLRFLRRLVTVLTAVMIGGLVVLIALIATRLPSPQDASVAPEALAERLELPAGSTARAVTFADGWIGVVTDAGEFLLFDAGSGALRQRIALDLPR
jgi:hypothetical protein